MYRTYRDTVTGGFVTKRDGGVTIRFQQALIVDARFVVDLDLKARGEAQGIFTHHAYIESQIAPTIRTAPVPLGEEIIYDRKRSVFTYAKEGDGWEIDSMSVVELSEGKCYVPSTINNG